MRPTPLLLPLVLLAADVEAQTPRPRERAPEREVRVERERVEIERDDRGSIRIRRSDAERDANRAYMGVSLGGGGSIRDTLGLLVSQVSEGSPAEQAGLEEGQRIQSVNGVNLRLSAADAEDPEMRGVPARRLMRELAKVKPGDAVELRVWENGQTRTVKVTTSEPPERRTASRIREEMENRAVLGVSVGGSGSVRDTLGLFVSRVTPEGPAEKAGVFEGDRIQAINGVDVRVPKEDAGDAMTASIRARRFTRELAKAKAGDAVELRVLRGGQVRTVRVTTVAAGALNERRSGSFFFGDAAGVDEIHVMPRMERVPGTPHAPMPPMRFRFEGGPGEVFELDALRERLDDVRPMLRSLPRVAPTPRFRVRVREQVSI